MKILVSACAFSPKWGSEPGVGWHWVQEICKEHDVTVLAHGYFRSHIDEHVQRHGHLPFEVIFADLLPLWAVPPERYMNSTLHFLRWQWHIRGLVKHLVSQERFDLIHHLTLGTLRYPAFLQGLGIPLVAGPLGGGERAPARFYRGLPWRERLQEAVRDVVILSAAWDPMIHWTWGRTELIMCRTSESRQALPWYIRPKVVIMQEIGCPPPLLESELPACPLPIENDTQSPELRCLFVGRLIAFKGLHLALTALNRLRERGVKVSLTVVGIGEIEDHLRAQCRALGLDDQVQWLGSMPREEVMRHYANHDVFLFPSLHDSGGTVVLEAISMGCPVVCLDLGGPPHFIDDTCGRVVPVGKRSVDEVIEGLCSVLSELARDPQGRHALRHGALRRASALSWPKRVQAAYRLIHERIRIR
jgi:glycosyltransferase involved in cell wall biosynthesis